MKYVDNLNTELSIYIYIYIVGIGKIEINIDDGFIEGERMKVNYKEEFSLEVEARVQGIEEWNIPRIENPSVNETIIWGENFIGGVKIGMDYSEESPEWMFKHRRKGEICDISICPFTSSNIAEVLCTGEIILEDMEYMKEECIKRMDVKSSVDKYSDKFIEYGSHPEILYYAYINGMHLLDLRTSRKYIPGGSCQHNIHNEHSIYGMKRVNEHNYLLVEEEYIKIYDIRNPHSPVSLSLHYMVDNPPSVFSLVRDNKALGTLGLGAFSGDFLDSNVVDTEEITDNKEIEYKYVGFNPDAHPSQVSLIPLDLPPISPYPYTELPPQASLMTEKVRGLTDISCIYISPHSHKRSSMLYSPGHINAYSLLRGASAIYILSKHIMVGVIDQYGCLCLEVLGEGGLGRVPLVGGEDPGDMMIMDPLQFIGERGEEGQQTLNAAHLLHSLLPNHIYHIYSSSEEFMEEVTPEVFVPRADGELDSQFMLTQPMQFAIDDYSLPQLHAQQSLTAQQIEYLLKIW